MGIGYRLAAIAMVALLGMTWWASMTGWGLRSTAQARAEALRRRRSVRPGGYGMGRYYGGGPRFGK